MQAILFNFSKRLNSTKRPNDAEGVSITVSIKQNVPKGQSSSQSGTETFLSHPTIWVQGDYTEYNYMKFKGRYYFVRDIQLTINNATVIYGEIDVLASYKEDILNTTAKVIYSSSNYNLNIDDVRNQETCAATVSQSLTAFPFDFTSDGTFLLTAQGGTRMATTYALSALELTVIAGKLNDAFGGVLVDAMDAYSHTGGIAALQTLFETIGQYLTDSVMEYFTSASECILDLKWSPLATSVFKYTGHAEREVMLGNFPTGVNGAIASGHFAMGSNVTVPIPHQSDFYSKGSRLSSYGIYIPFCGQYSLPNDDIYNSSNINIDLGIDCGTGDIAGTIYTSVEGVNNKRILSFSGCASASLMHSNYNKDMFMSVVNTLAQAIVMSPSLSMGNAVSKQIAKTSEVRLLSQVDKQHTAAGGTLSSAVGIASGNRIAVYSTMKQLADSKTAIRDVYGLPLHRTVQLGTLSGYCQCRNASVETNALLSFKEEINEFLNSGFYIE